MCKHKLRTMKKARALKIIAGWEMGFWVLICLWVVTWYIKRAPEQVFIHYVEEIGYGTEGQRALVLEHFKKDMEDWDKGLWAQAVTCFLFVPIALILLYGVKSRSRFLVLAWMILYVTVACVRSWSIYEFPRAFEWIKWVEFYWILRIYFLVIGGNYCLDLWSEAENAETLEPPMLIPLDDPRPWRGSLNYPEIPMTLDQRPRIYGTGRHIPMHLDWRYIAYPLPQWFESLDEAGNPILVIDNPAFNPDIR